MRAVVTMMFHHPTDGAELRPGFEFDSDRTGAQAGEYIGGAAADAYLQAALDDHECRHRVAVSDRTPAASPAPVPPPPVPPVQSPKPVDGVKE